MYRYKYIPLFCIILSPPCYGSDQALIRVRYVTYNTHCFISVFSWIVKKINNTGTMHNIGTFTVFALCYQLIFKIRRLCVDVSWFVGHYLRSFIYFFFFCNLLSKYSDELCRPERVCAEYLHWNVCTKCEHIERDSLESFFCTYLILIMAQL